MAWSFVTACDSVKMVEHSTETNSRSYMWQINFLRSLPVMMLGPLFVFPAHGRGYEKCVTLLLLSMQVFCRPAAVSLPKCVLQRE